MIRFDGESLHWKKMIAVVAVVMTLRAMVAMMIRNLNVAKADKTFGCRIHHS